MNFSIEVDKDFPINYLMTHCRWLPGSAFSTTQPTVVNRKFIKNFHLPPKVLCICNNNNEKDCYTDTLASVHPGQSITVKLSINETILNDQPIQTAGYWAKKEKFNSKYTTIAVEMNEEKVPPTACRLAKLTEVTREIHNHCTAVNYIIMHNTLSNLKWCELFISVHPKYFEGYYINILPCPPGFVLSTAICTCDPILNTRLISIIMCDIDHQTVL